MDAAALFIISSINLHCNLIHSLDEERIGKGILSDQINLALEELFKLIGKAEEVVGILAKVHWLKGDEQINVAGRAELFRADRAERGQRPDLSASAQGSDLLHVVADDPVHGLRGKEFNLS
jgi:hypothetical protein